MAKLSREDIVTMKKLSSLGESNSSIARRFGVTEGTVRYHKKRDGLPDRRQKDFLIVEMGFEGAVRNWWEHQIEHQPAHRPPLIRSLYTWLVEEYGYSGSYVSVRRFVRKAFGMPKKRALRRIETPPGAQTQTDWGTRTVDIGDPEGPTELQAFIMKLSHSRFFAIVWSRNQKQLSWQHDHNEAYRRLEGVAPVNRIDNLKTGISSGAGAWGKINPTYRGYARQMRFHVDAHESYSPEQKGKVEAAVKILDRLGLSEKRFESLEELQAWTDEQVLAEAKKRICPPTGRSVYQSWLAEIPFLQPLPETLPVPFDVIRNCQVHQGCTINFEGRQYEVPFIYLCQKVEVRGTSGEVHIHDPNTGKLLLRYPRHTQERILLRPGCHEGYTSDTIIAPKPFGKMARKMLEIQQMAVQERPLDTYAAYAEVAR